MRLTKRALFFMPVSGDGLAGGSTVDRRETGAYFEQDSDDVTGAGLGMPSAKRSNKQWSVHGAHLAATGQGGA